VKLLLDQNLSRSLVRQLSDQYPESVHVAEIGLDTATDREIWEYAGQRDYIIVSKDSDFRQLALLFGPPPHVVWLRVGNVSTHEIEAVLRRRVAACPVAGRVSSLRAGRVFSVAAALPTC
jgi:predicted nuclease of predicted toxin-antitoxin system